MANVFKLPDLGEGIHEGEVLAVLVAVGDQVEEGDPILEIETDKAAVEIPSPYTGIVQAIRVKPGDVVHVGDELIVFDSPSGEAAAGAPELTTTSGDAGASTVQSAVRDREPVPASPATRRLARELGVDLYDVTASGPAGLVTAEDVRAAADGKAKGDMQPPPSRDTPPAEPAPPPLDSPPQHRPLALDAPVLPAFERWGDVERIPVRSIRRATAKQMALAWSQIPHVANQDVVDVTRLEAFRQKHKERINAQGGRLTLTIFTLKAAAAALKRHPRFNASLDTAAGEMILKHYYHIGVAMDTAEGLVVPVLRDVDRKSLSDLATELYDIGLRAKERKLAPEEMQGATFTITNVGAMGGGNFAPIINYPQVAILGMGQARRQPVVREEKGGRMDIVPRLMMPMVVSFDHRVLDGADAIRFMQDIMGALADPEQLMMTM